MSGDHNRPDLDRRIEALTILLVLGLTVLLYSQPVELTSDDAYITLRYAENFARGRGLVFNPGEKVYGLTTPLYGLVLGLLGRAGVPLTAAPRWVNLAAAAALVFTMRQAGRYFFGSRAAGIVAALALLSAPPAAVIGLFGMETLIFLNLVALGFRWLEDRPVLSLIIFGIGLGVRVESGLALGVAALFMAARQRGWRRFPPLAVAAALVLVYGAAGWSYYGLPLPLSVVRKAHTASSRAGAEKVAAFFGAMTAGFYPFWMPIINPGMALPVLAALHCARAPGRELKKLAPLFFFIMLYMLSFIAAGKEYALHFVWYYVPVLLLVCLPAGAFMAKTVSGLLARAGPRAAAAAPLLIAAGWAALAFYPVTTRLQSAAASCYHREHSYAAAGVWLHRFSGPAERVASNEIGALGFYSERPVLDAFGLVSSHPLTTSELQFVLERQPEYIVYMDYFPEIEAIRAATLGGYRWVKWRTLWIGSKAGSVPPAPEDLEKIFTER